ncbi:MAG: DUF4339 domain-containing protein [Verrucomicrobiota bacterium]
MNYFLWHEGKEFGPYDEASVKESLETGSISAGTLGRRETETGWKPIESLLPPPNAKPPVEQKQAGVISKEEYEEIAAKHMEEEASFFRRKKTINSYREAIRGTTAYGGLRGFMTFMTVLAVFAGVICTIGGFADSNAVVAIGGITLAVTTPVTRAFSFVIIDIADALLLEHSKNKQKVARQQSGCRETHK